MNWINYCLAFLAMAPIAATIVLAIFLARKGRSAMGQPTILPVFFYTGKFFLFGLWALLAVVSILPESRLVVPFLLQESVPDVQLLMAAVLLVPANLIIVPAYVSMGIVTHIGLPQGKHELRTSGIYRFSRNPMYASFIFLNAAAFLVIPSLLVLAVAIYGMVVHHFIILGEERYLIGEFGESYLSYKSRTPRYF